MAQNKSIRKTGEHQTFVLIPQESFEEFTSIQQRILDYLNGNVSNHEPGIGDYISKEEAKRITGKGDTTLWHLRRTGKIKAAKMGAEVFYSRQSILDYLNKNLK